MVNKDKTSPEYKEKMTNPAVFNLSEKEWTNKSYTGYLKDDVKEFIRLLKEEISMIFYNCKDECGMTDLIIDKLAGEKLK